MTTNVPQNNNDNGAAIVAGPQARLNFLKTFLDERQKSIAPVLPKHLTAERLVKIAASAASRNPELLDCTPVSILVCLIDCGTLGLEPATPLGHAHLVPFMNNQAHQRESQLVIGYKGMIQLAHWSGEVADVYAHEVCKNDYFKYRLGTNRELLHEPTMDDRGEIVAFYAVVEYLSGAKGFAVMSKRQVDQIREFSASSKNAKSPWTTAYDQMGCKTAVRRMMKMVPMSPEKPLARGLAVDEAHEWGRRSNPLADMGFLDEPQIIDSPADAQVVTPSSPDASKSRGDALADKLAGKAGGGSPAS